MQATTEMFQIRQRFREASFNELQAEALTREIYGAITSLHSNEFHLDAKFKELDAKLDHKLEKMHANLLKWFISISLTQIIGIFIPLILALITHLSK